MLTCRLPYLELVAQAIADIEKPSVQSDDRSMQGTKCLATPSIGSVLVTVAAYMFLELMECSFQRNSKGSQALQPVLYIRIISFMLGMRMETFCYTLLKHACQELPSCVSLNFDAVQACPHVGGTRWLHTMYPGAPLTYGHGLPRILIFLFCKGRC